MSIWDASLETANRWYDISWYGLLVAGLIAALASALTIVFLFLQFWSASVRDKYTEVRTTTLESQTARANADLGTARADIAKANVAISEATARAAEATSRALEAKLELAKFKEPRTLSPEQQKRISTKMIRFKGLRAVLGAVPPSAKNTELLEQILAALKSAEVDAFINLNGVEASVSPTGQSNSGTMLTNGFPSGVSVLT